MCPLLTLGAGVGGEAARQENVQTLWFEAQ